VIDGCTLK